MFSKFYVDAVKQSRNMHLMRVMEGQADTTGVAVFETALDMGRRSGKTKAAFEIIRQSKGTLNIYVAPTKQLAVGEAQRFEADCENLMLLSSRQDLTTIFRGRRIEHQAINLIFDECNTKFDDRWELVQTLMICMRNSNLHPFPYIHIIRLGM
ncbi:hypothetical protein RB16p146 [Escherichia phage RB16]|uniref:Conserved hypothetical phage protein n=1 Tax=Escherichia phage RB16 TaxID=2681599 RepID=D9ICK7_BPRB1|nr:hypothetical protein RB16p146 [Escherichia phage RB16]ADJ55450.1 conserved hypothetical phage protein [Escherichia phage RB16]QJI10814.1 hypothetical protein GuL6_156 [Buttiauxella phage vB_ButM_GuL6]